MSKEMRDVPWGKALRAMRSGSLNGCQGVMVAAVTAWAELQQDMIIGTIQRWAEAGGMDKVSSRKVSEAGRVFLAGCPSVTKSMWNDLTQGPLLGRIMLFTFYEAGETDSATDSERLSCGKSQILKYGESLLAERCGQAVVANLLFLKRHSAILRERRAQRVINSVHDR